MAKGRKKMERQTVKVDVYQSYLCMKINSLEVQKLRPDESRHHKRMANFQLDAYKDALSKYREVKKHGGV